ncbi:hypothetical protein ACSAZK_15245 [Methanosarcina sp. Mfa9]|uniref:hypothetical protein n=1 Tax=Methanosarcina sp. Mfa9 TaxID=3439063 RepID=UPI003F859655
MMNPINIVRSIYELPLTGHRRKTSKEEKIQEEKGQEKSRIQPIFGAKSLTH